MLRRNRFPSGNSLLAFALALTVLGGAGSWSRATAQDFPIGFACLWLDDPMTNGSSSPGESDAFNCAGDLTTVEHTADGAFTVVISGFGPGSGSTQVTASGAGTESRVFGKTGYTSANLQLFAKCFDIASGAVHSRFSPHYVAAVNVLNADTPSAYMFVEQLPASYTLEHGYIQDSTGEATSGEHVSTGQYVVRSPGLRAAEAGGNVQVTAFGGNSLAS